jgi:hypothetical protein
VLQDENGDPPEASTLDSLSYALNQFHDQWSVHMNEAITWMHVGTTILRQLILSDQLEAIAKTGKGGSKEKINWEEVAAQVVNCFKYSFF